MSISIADFGAADDTIALDDAVFAGLGAGALDANAFVIGTAAQDADDRIIYDQADRPALFRRRRQRRRRRGPVRDADRRIRRSPPSDFTVI